MAVLDVLVYPDARLKQVSAPVMKFNAELHSFLADLEATMRAGPGSVGIAAPQVGRLFRIVIVDVSSKPNIPQHSCLRLINPEIVQHAGQVKGREGCMSVPDFTGSVLRAQSVRVRAQDARGQWHEIDCEGYEARAVQHEIDHLNGLLFLDRVVSPRHDLFLRRR